MSEENFNLLYLGDFKHINLYVEAEKYAKAGNRVSPNIISDVFQISKSSAINIFN